MEYRSLGRTGIKVSQFCLGTMMFGGRTNKEDSIEIIDHALDTGVNFIDTANVYAANKSKRIVGKTLARDGKREHIVLATKAFMPQGEDVNDRGPTRRHLLKACDDSLKRLKTDWIDLYQMHRSTAEIPIDETLRALDDLIRAGKVRYIGASMFPSWRMVESLWVARELGLNRFVCEQPAYHMLDRTAEREMIPAAQTFGIGIIPWGPLCGGLLSGKYRRDSSPQGARWQDGKDNFNREATPLAWDVIDLLRDIASEKGCSVSQLALAWCAAQPGVTAPIIGPRTLDQVSDNLGATSVEVTAYDCERIDALVPPCASAVRYFDRANRLDLRPNQFRNLV
ncbi:MAG: aldo/keto reductase [Pseudomonadales bacterium]|jgi:aryl-alcohol dehydrogenase-like predicted oxidoreductase|nr:aldo/keto reductase [Pseudomonadales bacterium]MDP6469674.1 aldo/keto reductase [Pseudomonadales bacterium]MDP6828915.1 aldo/keto reductase [Pseudomonadales bacterium]MDP6972715.1 aldo/keto reductase [Pseudomonadales bacterium]